jgi:hypothetical protein
METLYTRGFDSPGSAGRLNHRKRPTGLSLPVARYGQMSVSRDTFT